MVRCNTGQDLGADFQLFFEQSPDDLLVLLPDTPRYTAVAATQGRLDSMHRARQQIFGRGLLDLVPGPQAGETADLLASLERVLATRLPDTMAVEKHDAPLPGGGIEVRYLRSHNIPILSPSGEVRYILHRTVDVTEWEREIDRVRRELDAFSHSVTHDLRGPLHSIDGFCELLLEENAGQLNAEGRDRLNMVRKGAQRMAQLIEGLLRFTRLSRGELHRIPFELSMLVRSVAMQIREGKDGRPFKLTIQDGVNVDGDPHLLQIVLENLLSNAWKFTSKRADAEIEFGSGQSDADGRPGETYYYVRDNGAGFDMSEFHGTGVGLATVKRVVERHGGRVWAVGEVDKGATFYFTLGGAARSSEHWAAVSKWDSAG
jgi:signal transduction histidine kinase